MSLKFGCVKSLWESYRPCCLRPGNAARVSVCGWTRARGTVHVGRALAGSKNPCIMKGEPQPRTLTSMLRVMYVISHFRWFLWSFGEGLWVMESGLWSTLEGKIAVVPYAVLIVLGTLFRISTMFQRPVLRCEHTAGPSAQLHTGFGVS